MMSEDDDFDIILQDSADILFDRLKLGSGRKHVASRDRLRFSSLLLLSKATHQFVTLSDGWNWEIISQYFFNLCYNWFLSFHIDDLPLFWW